MKKIETQNIVAAILAALLLAIPAIAGENIYANGTITIAAGATAGTNLVELRNISGQEWGEIAAFRFYNGSGTQAYVRVTCTDPTAATTLIDSEPTGTNTAAQVAKGTTWSIVGTNLYARNLQVVISLVSAYTNAASSMPWMIYAK